MSPSSPNPSDVLHPAQQAVLDLYASDLSALKFPDVDRNVLENAAEKVRTEAQAVKAAEEALAAARAAMQESQEVLMQKCQRALAYARVYAEENPELAQKVEAISLPRLGKRGRVTELPAPAAEEPAESKSDAAPKRRGRPPKSSSGALFADEGTLEHEGKNGATGQA